jgi:hypothetical protein
MGITYLVSSRPDMGAYFLQFTSRKFSDPFVSDTGGQRAVFGFGADIPYHDPSTAIRSVFHVDGLFFIGLTAIFVLGVVTILFHFRRFLPVMGVVILGVTSSVAVLKTPLLSTVQRLSLPLSLFFSIIAGIGLWSLVSSSNESRSGMDRHSRTVGIKSFHIRSLAVAGLIILLGVTGPLVAGDDLYGLHAGPNMWETYSTPEQQVEFSEQEIRELEVLTGHAIRYAPNVTMLSVTNRANTRFGGHVKPSPTEVSASGIRANETFAYRTKWTEHQVGYSTNRAGTLSIADWWLQREVSATNKVYTTGMTGIIWENNLNLSSDGIPQQQEHTYHTE